MANLWTSEQQSAISTKGGALIVSAAAGSGKTAVLVERVIEAILDGASIDRYLIVTFTVAAAGEMRERIANAISEKLSESPFNRHLQRQNVLVHKAKICTIDSFCIELVRSNFNLLGISPDFKIADETELALIRQAICDTIIEEGYSSEDKDFFNLADNFGSDKSDSTLNDIIFKIANVLETVPFSDQWLQKTIGYYNEENGIWLEEAFNSVLDMVLQYINAYNTVMVELADYPELYEKYKDTFCADMEMLEDVVLSLKNNKWDISREKAISYEFPRMPSVRGYTEHPAKQRASKIRDLLKKDIASLENGLFSLTEKDMKEDLARLKPLVSSLFEVVKKYENALWEEKLKLNILTFSDIAKLTIKLLVEEVEENTKTIKPTQIALQTAALFDEIMIDEYQDTNEVQDLIFGSISKNRSNVFIVGDVKQSIYRFRSACPQIFISRKEEADGSTSKLINLSKNFRSRKTVLDFINFFYSQTMTKSFGEMDYNEKEMLYLGADFEEQAGYETEIDILEYTSSNENEDEAEALSRDEKEAIYVAKRVKALIDEGFLVYDNEIKAKRKVREGDFAILLRSLKNRGEIFRSALERVGVSAFCEATASYFDAYEIEMVISLLQAIDNPYNDIPLLAAMRSPVFSFSPDELAKIRLFDTRGYYYNAVQKAAAENEKCQKLIDKLAEFRAVSRDLPVYRLLMHIYNDTALFSIVGGMDGGFMRQENLNQLCRHAKNFEAASIKGLYGFVNFINKIIEKNGDLSGAKASPAGNSVLVTTIHKSKGLEFPVCIVAGCSVQFNKSDLYAPLLIHQDYGIGIRIRDVEKLAEFTTMPREVIKNVLMREALSEELRILYVAMTRAKEKLIITTAVKNLDNKLGALALQIGKDEKINPYLLMSCGSFSDWILACLLRHTSGTDLKERAGYNYNDDEEGFDLKINILDITNNSTEQESLKAETPKEESIDSELLNEIKTRLDYAYQYKGLSLIPAKVSVSELKGRRNEDDNSEKLIKAREKYSKPQFLLDDKLSATSVGIALHRFMQYASFESLNTIEEINQQINNSILTEAEAKSMRTEEILKFIQSPLCQRLINSKTVVKEHRFTTEIPANEYTNEQNFKDETILLQGVIDCFFEEEDGIVLLDYKTDFITDENVLTERYRLQLDYYARAIEELYGISVKQKYLYSFTLGKEIEII